MKNAQQPALHNDGNFHGKNMRVLIPEEIEGKFKIISLPIPKPSNGEVLIKILAAPVNPSDLGRIKSVLAENNKELFVPGLEGCGEVIEIGGGFLPFLLKGKRVACNAAHLSSGTWAEYMVTPATRCFPLPKKISNEQGAMHFVNPMTAIAFFRIIKTENHDAVINMAANSALGKMVVVLARKKGIALINVVRSIEQQQELQAFGAENVLNSSCEKFYSELEEKIFLLKPTLMLDPVGGSLSREIFRRMPQRSHSLIYGTLSGEDTTVQPRTLIAEEKKISGFFLADYLKKHGLAVTIKMILNARSLIKNDIQIKIREIIGLEKAEISIENYLHKMSLGKIIINPWK